MKTAEYIKAVKGLGLSVYKYSSNTIEVKDNSNCKVVCIATEGMYVLDTDFIAFVGLDETIRKKTACIGSGAFNYTFRRKRGRKALSVEVKCTYFN